jgi:signal peptidase II
MFSALPTMSKKNSKIILWCFIFGTLLFDQWTKFLAEIYLQTESIYWGKWLSFSLSHNTGCAWSLLPNSAFLLAILSIFLLGIVIKKRYFFGIYDRPISFGLLLGGILGNAVDRFFRGFVIDFIDVDLQFYRWPAFNIADASLCVATIFLVLVTKKI